jgi:hypothetical protein
VTSDECGATRGAQRIEDNSLVLLQVNCRSILNKYLDFWNLVDIYNPDVIIHTESWLREEISNAEEFRDDYTSFRRDRNIRGGEVFICVKDCNACAELWVDMGSRKHLQSSERGQASYRKIGGPNGLFRKFHKV